MLLLVVKKYLEEWNDLLIGAPLSLLYIDQDSKMLQKSDSGVLERFELFVNKGIKTLASMQGFLDSFDKEDPSYRFTYV